MMMKNLIKTLWFILAVAWPSVAMATSTIQSNIINLACIEVTAPDWTIIQKCDDVEISPYTCLSINSNWNVVELDVNNEWKMRFTCYASDTTKPQHSFKIDCGNDTYQTTGATNSSSFSAYCEYWADDVWRTLDVACYVDDFQMEHSTNPACITKIKIGNPIPLNVCWNWRLEKGEECDLWRKPAQVEGNPKKITQYLDLYNEYPAWDDEGKSCKSCKMINDSGYVYEPAECLAVDSPISVMNEEIIPYWRRLLIEDATLGNQEECIGYEGENTLLNKDTMKCKFNVYNWKHNESWNPIQTFREDCYNENINKPNSIYSYFDANHQTQNNVAWAAINSILSLTNGEAKDEFWEYKLVLETVKYQYCDTGNNDTWTRWDRYWAVCQVDFAVTKPYAMQISTFGAKPIGASDEWDFLYNFYDMEWNQLLGKTDLWQIINIGDATYSNEENVQDEINKFRNKYEKLAVQVTSNVLQSNQILKKLTDAGAKKVMKVPNQNIYFLYWDGGTFTLGAGTLDGLPAYTIFVDWMDVEIEWNVLQYAMIITTQKMSFKDGWPKGTDQNIMRCASWWQVVQWLYIAWEGFKAAVDEPNSLKNKKANELWCPWWWLHVKWALIWAWIDQIENSKRSQLNSWFNVNSNPMRERRQKIIGWASVLIEYSPSLWKTLPPGAEIFTESLEVYRK